MTHFFNVICPGVLDHSLAVPIEQQIPLSCGFVIVAFILPLKTILKHLFSNQKY